MSPQSAVVSRRSIETWTLWALMATMAVALVAVVPGSALPVTTTKTFVLAFGAVITLMLFIVARLTRGTLIFPPLVLVGALWLPTLAYLLSAAFSGVAFSSAVWGLALEADTLGVLLAASVLGTLAALAVRRAEQYRLVLTVGGWLYGALALLHALTLLLGQVIPATISPSFSLVGSYEDLAFLLGLGVVSSLVAARFFDLSSKTRKVLSAATILSLGIIAVANVTVVWVLLVLVSLGLFIESALMRKQPLDASDLDDVAVVSETAVESPSETHSIAFALPVLAVAVFFLMGSNLGGALADAFKVNIVSVNPSWQSTFAVAQQTYGSSAVFGTGPSTFASQWLKYRDPSINNTLFWNVDFAAGSGIVPTSLVTTGLVGALAWGLLFLAFIGLGLRTLIVRTPQDSVVRGAAILSFVATVYLFAIAVFRLPSVPLFVLGFVFAGIFASTMRFALSARQRGVIFAESPRVGFVIVFSLTLLLFVSIVGAYSLVGRYVATLSLAQATRAYGSGDSARAESLVTRSLSFAPTALAYQAQGELAIGQLRMIAASTTLPAAEAQKAFQTALSAGINAALTATQLAPESYRNWMTLGNLYAQAVPLGVSGAYDSAKTAFDKAKELHPTSPEINFILAQLNLAHKDLPAAKEALKTAVSLKQDYTNAIFLLSQLEVQEGNVKAALASALSAAYFAPNDANVLFQVGVLRAAEADYAGAVEALTAAVKANAQFANARYFLAAVYAKQTNYKASLEELKAIADLSSENATVVAPLITSLEAGKNPFPANLLTIAPPPVASGTAPAQ